MTWARSPQPPAAPRWAPARDTCPQLLERSEENRVENQLDREIAAPAYWCHVGRTAKLPPGAVARALARVMTWVVGYEL